MLRKVGRKIKMGFNYRCYVGVCIRIHIPADKESFFRFSDKLKAPEKLAQINGNWCEPPGDFYYLQPNYQTEEIYGWSRGEGEPENGIIIDPFTIEILKEYFQEEFKEEIKLLKEYYGYDKVQVLFAAVNGGG